MELNNRKDFKEMMVEKLTLLLLSSTCDCIRLNFLICAFLSSYKFDKLKWLFVEFWDCWLLEDCCCDCWSNKLLFSRNSEILQNERLRFCFWMCKRELWNTYPNDGLIDKLSPNPGDITDCWNWRKLLSFESWWFVEIILLIFWLELLLILKMSVENKFEWFAVGL